MSDLSQCRAVIVVFAMDGCHHCHEYLPRFQKMVGRFQAKGWPFVVYDGNAPEPGSIPVLIVDGASMHPTIVELADRHQVDGMPTTLVMPRAREAMKLEGAVDDRELYDALIAICTG